MVPSLSLADFLIVMLEGEAKKTKGMDTKYTTYSLTASQACRPDNSVEMRLVSVRRLVGV